MKKEQPNLELGLVDFEEPTLLLLGETSSFDWLACRIAEGCEFALKGRVSLKFIPSMQEGELSGTGNEFEWHMSHAEMALVAQQLRELATGDVPAHAYLDSIRNTAGIQIMASKGEYEPARIFSE